VQNALFCGMSEFLQEVELFIADTGLETGVRKNKDFIAIEGLHRTLFFATYSWLRKEQIPENIFVVTEDEWRRNKEAVQSRIYSILKLTHRIHGRSCELKTISRSEAKAFIDANHIMGYAQSQFHYGLFHKGRLVAAAAFSKGRKMRRLPEDKLSYEIVRFCNLNFHTVVGGLSKLIKSFERDLVPGDIITYIDTSWAEPAAYYALGFANKEEMEPMEFLINMKSNQRIVANEEYEKTDDWIFYRNKGNIKLIKDYSSEAG
jgi:hypothetical protein